MNCTLTKSQSDWIQENGYFEPQYVTGLGWYAFKDKEVIPTFIQPYFIMMEYNRQRVYPGIDLIENL
jgi:hypothetical protein